jgi:hypothetical protein
MGRGTHNGKLRLTAVGLFLLVPLAALAAGEMEAPVARTYAIAPPAVRGETSQEAEERSAGCKSCHTASDSATMHNTPAVVLGCTDCHGGNASVSAPRTLSRSDTAYASLRDRAHVLPLYPEAWNYPSSAKPQASYTLLNRESPEFIRFVNPSDLRVARQACGDCHLPIIQAAERSLMATGAMFLEGAAYNNGILPFKKSNRLGEAYSSKGEPAKVESPGNPPGQVSAEQAKRGAMPYLLPLPRWQTTPPADIFRVFERGGKTIGTQFPEIGLPDSKGDLEQLDEPGRPEIRQSNRGPGTGLRVAIPILNIHKTRLNDPFTWFMGTNDQPGDYRQSGCAACHVVYANDREPRHSLGYSQYGHDGKSASVDPTIDKTESGHPIRHQFTSAIPTSQCMICHMHQPNMFVNSFLGYTMWDYESDAPAMWPEKQKYPTAAEVRAVNERNPEGAAPRGNWADVDFLRNVSDLNPRLKDTQFADYHGHGWNFRAVFKRDREGFLLDANNQRIKQDDPEKWRLKGQGKFVPPGVNPGKAVQLMDVHAEKGMQCADCHFAQDSHGSGLIFGEVANAVEIGCKDCHGSINAYPTLRTSGPAAGPHGGDLTLLRNADGRRRFEWVEKGGRRILMQRSIVDPKLEWKVSLVRDTVDPASPDFNPKAARAKLMSKLGTQAKPFAWGRGVAQKDLAHKDSQMECFACHTSWATSCSGCHLPIEANWKSTVHKYEGDTSRNFATYNPQVARDDMFQLGHHMTTKGNMIAPVRSSSALILSSTNINRERIYVQQPPISAIGFSSQAFAPHFPHTVRKTETKTCDDCHLSAANDNNAIMAQLLLLGTNTVNFVGMHAWTGLEGGIEAVRVTEWSEPQAVFGSYLHRYAYPDYYKLHVEKNHRELIDWVRGETFDKNLSGETHPSEDIRNVTQQTDGAARCLQLRGEFMYVAEGAGGFRAYDVASIANKDVSDKILTAPFSPLGQDMHVASRNATCMALPTNQPIDPTRNTPEMQKANEEQPFHPIYNYAVITDSDEGLILVNINPLAQRDPRQRFLKRAVTWNPGGVLNGARHITLGGHYAYVAAASGLVVVDLNDPLHPKLSARIALPDVRASALQFRYLFVTDARGLEVLDVTRLDEPKLIEGARVPLTDARRVYVARTYAYVAAKSEGLVIIDVMNPERPSIYQRVTFDGQLNDAEDVVVGSTNASMFAYVADGRNGMKVLQLTSPATQPNFYGFSPAPKPELIAWARTPTPALAMSKGLDRDRAVDETGGQIAVFGRTGSRPFTRKEMERFFLDSKGAVYRVTDQPSLGDMVPVKREAKTPRKHLASR